MNGFVNAGVWDNLRRRERRTEQTCLADTPDLVPLSSDNFGPLKWDRGPIWMRWQDFPASVLYSQEGAHLLKVPCSIDWWKNRKADGIDSPGHIIKTPDEEYIFEGWLTKEVARERDTRSFRTITISSRSRGETVAEFDDISSVSFRDGASFAIKPRHLAPVLIDQVFEFIDGDGVSQFCSCRVKRLLLNKGTDRMHILLLLAAERFIREVAWASGKYEPTVP